ncbi:hypothetical protein D3C77_172910 [compost metagenome]
MLQMREGLLQLHLQRLELVAMERVMRVDCHGLDSRFRTVLLETRQRCRRNRDNAGGRAVVSGNGSRSKAVQNLPDDIRRGQQRMHAALPMQHSHATSPQKRGPKRLLAVQDPGTTGGRQLTNAVPGDRRRFDPPTDKHVEQRQLDRHDAGLRPLRERQIALASGSDGLHQ